MSLPPIRVFLVSCALSAGCNLEDQDCICFRSFFCYTNCSCTQDMWNFPPDFDHGENCCFNELMNLVLSRLDSIQTCFFFFGSHESCTASNYLRTAVIDPPHPQNQNSLPQPSLGLQSTHCLSAWVDIADIWPTAFWAIDGMIISCFLFLWYEIGQYVFLGGVLPWWTNWPWFWTMTTLNGPL